VHVKRVFARVTATLMIAAFVPIGARGDERPPPTKTECATAYEQGQRLQKSGALLKARDAFILCARDPCPTAFQPECVQWLAETEKRIPSVIVQVRDRSGTTQAEVRLSIDGVLVLSRLTGKSIEVDPGDHVFRIEPIAGTAVEQRVLVVEGERSRLVTFTVDGEAPTGASATSKRSSIAPWLIYGAFGLGAVGAASFAYFGLHGLSQRRDLEDCNHRCSADVMNPTLDRARRDFLLADISIGVSLAALTTGVVLLLASSPTDSTSDAAATTARRPPLVDVTMSKERASLALSWTF
jgi:hypothetical protein